MTEHDGHEAADAAPPAKGGDLDTTTPERPVAKDVTSDAAALSGEGSDDAPSRTGALRFRYFGVSDVGLVREHNEDNFIAFDVGAEGKSHRMGGTPGDGSERADAIREAELSRSLILAVCDGMGGAAAGEVASQMAVDTVLEIMTAPTKVTDRDAFAHRLVYAIEDAGSRIFGAAKMDRSRRGMGTTATVAGFVDEVLFVGQVGDSRCYVLRNGELAQVTKDQSLVNQLIEAGQLTEEEAEAFEHSNIILQALGTTEEVSVDLTFLELRQGDRVMLCSDGLSGMVHAETIREALAEGDDLEAIADRLVQLANDGGGHDNISCVVAEVSGPRLLPAEGAPEAGYQQYPLPPARPEVASELPRREGPAPKPGVKKPGRDVKPHAVVQAQAADPTVPTAGFPWWVLAILFAAVVGTLAYVLLGQDEAPPPPPPPEAPATVGLRVRTNAEGDLYVDGRYEASGAAARGDRNLSLAPGDHLIEVRRAGQVLASHRVTVEAGDADRLVELRVAEAIHEEEELSAEEQAALEQELEAMEQELAAERGANAPDAAESEAAAGERAAGGVAERDEAAAPAAEGAPEAPPRDAPADAPADAPLSPPGADDAAPGDPSAATEDAPPADAPPADAPPAEDAPPAG